MNASVAITTLPGGETLHTAKGCSLLEALADRMPVRADCGGQGICGRCRVAIKNAANLPLPTPAEESSIPPHLIAGGYRLACQVQVREALTIWIPPAGRDSHRRGAKNLLSGPYPVNAIRKITGLGLAVDLGTTTVAAYLGELESGRILSSAVTGNPQVRHGEDVISRIQMARRSAEDLARLRMLARQAVNYLADVCLQAAARRRKEMREAVVVGNPAMEHIFAGIDPSGLARAPFEPATFDAVEFPARSLDLDFPTGTRMYVMPVIAGFVGGDTLACILADRPQQRKETTLIVDVGTNGELVLATRGQLWATSCATGPAFEGARISSGMRAVAGAIVDCSIDPATFRFSCRTIGSDGEELPPLGFCGSGLLDAVAALRKSEIVGCSGRIEAGRPLVIDNGGAVAAKVVFMAAAQNPAGIEISLTQRDIRQVQLAKAALAAGIETLMRKAGAGRVDRTILTGAFGSAFDWSSAVAIGMLPPEGILGHVIHHPNLAGEGAVRALFAPEIRAEARRIARRVRYVNLAAEAEFNRRFVEQLHFPDRK